MDILATLVAFALVALTCWLCLEPYRITDTVRAVGRFLAAGVPPGLLTGEAGLLFQRINRSSPERVFVVVKNNYATAALAVGQGVQWDFAGAADGVSVTRPSARATNAGIAACGAVAETINSAGYGLIQVYGYNANLRVRTLTGGAPAMVAGSPLVLNAAGSVFCFENTKTASTVILTFPCGFAITASAGWTTAVRAGFLKCL